LMMSTHGEIGFRAMCCGWKPFNWHSKVVKVFCAVELLS
jgi:hypothetical protein